jgi:hypothetical protein
MPKNQIMVNGIATPFLTAHLAMQAAMLLPVQTKSAQYRDRAIVLINRHNAAPGLLRKLVFTSCQDIVAVVMILLACRPLMSTILTHGKMDNPNLDRLIHVYNEMHNVFAMMADLTEHLNTPVSVDELCVRYIICPS